MKSHQLYYTDPYMKSFKARVLSCRPVSEGYEIILEQTAFYPEGGGQPADTGYIGECQITHVKNTAEGIVHIGDIPLEEGMEYDAGINWEKRFDHMQHHTAEHVVSGVIHKLYGADNVGFNIGEQHITIDFNVELSYEDIENIEILSNEAVLKNLPVNVEYFDSTPPFSYRSKKELKGTIRIVSVEDYDICACAGTQLARTGEIGIIKIISVQKYKSGSRLYLLCGQRALRDYQAKDNSIRAISTLLSSKPYETFDHVIKLHEEKEALRFELLSTKYTLIDMKCEKFAPADKILIFEDDLSGEEMKRYITNLSERVGSIAVFSGCDINGYRYLITSSVIDLPAFIKGMNTELNGKGGGVGIAGGHIRASKSQIDEFFTTF